MYRFSVDKAFNGYVLYVQGADDVELIGIHIFSTKEGMIAFIEANLKNVD